MYRELLSIVEDFELLWELPGFAGLLAARLAAPAQRGKFDDPCDVVLAEHHRLLAHALRQAQSRVEVAAGRAPGDLADALVGCYLIRRLAGGPLDGWAHEAIATIVQL